MNVLTQKFTRLPSLDCYTAASAGVCLCYCLFHVQVTCDRCQAEPSCHHRITSSNSCFVCYECFATRSQFNRQYRIKIAQLPTPLTPFEFHFFKRRSNSQGRNKTNPEVLHYLVCSFFSCLRPVAAPSDTNSPQSAFYLSR